jgi:gliding motility-associated-like protein
LHSTLDKHFQQLEKRANLFRLTFLLAFVCFTSTKVLCQCVQLPFREDFEASDGGWKTGGVASDWEWGEPKKNKLVALDGKKCWTTGGLSKGSYNNNELSWLQSPCFDFSNIEHPYIVFRYFLDTEKNFDGATLQYSLDGGTNWTRTGSVLDINDCQNYNWFNTPIIRFANEQQGWSGSNFWLWANHTLPFLAGKPSVTFRFVFGAGSINNNYEGFAIDDFFAGETDDTDAGFSYICATSTTVDFTALSRKGCASYEWNFDDPASGELNISKQFAAAHIFSAPGQYKVTLRTSGPANRAAETTQIINILKPIVSITTSPTCAGKDNGIAVASTDPSVTGVVYAWSTTPAQQGDTAFKLSSGGYTVSATAPNSCSVTVGFVITNRDTLKTSSVVNQATCKKNDGSIALNTIGGTSPYSYNWFPNVSNNAMAQKLGAGMYNILVTDAVGCRATVRVNVTSENVPLATISAQQNIDCNAKDGSATVNVTGGQQPYTYQWLSTGGSLSSESFTTPGMYSVVATDANGCADTATVNIVEQTKMKAVLARKDDTCGNGQGSATATITGGVAPITYGWSSPVATYATQTIENLGRGTYLFTATDNIGCKVTSQVVIEASANSADCGEVYFPSAFTPNGDTRNETFGPLGGLTTIKNYELQIFNRWGQLIFKSTNPSMKWNGKTGDYFIPGAYIYFARYTTSLHQKGFQKGTVVLVR